MAALPPDPWKALGVEKNADKSEIRTAYKKLVLKCHPDKVQDPTLKAQKQEEFQKVQQAYELLNDDAERTKYEDQVKLHELRRQAAMMAKSMPNTSASRSTSTRTFEIRTAVPNKQSSSNPSKMFGYQTSSRSHEDFLRHEIPDKAARRPSSFEKSGSYREEDRRDRDKDRERRSRRDPEDDYRIKDKERERERDRLRAKEQEVKEREREYRKKSTKDRDVDRKRGQEEKRRNFSPYIEELESAEEQATYSSKTEKKRSSSKKPYEPRDKSTTSRRAPSPHIDTVAPQAPVPPPVPEVKYADDLDKAATYIERSRRQSNRSSQEPPVFQREYPPVVPTPPPAEVLEDDDIPHRSRARRTSHDASRSREKLMPSRDPYIVSASPKTSASRMPPALHKSYTSPPELSSSPRSGLNRSNTTPMEYAASPPHHVPPTLPRTSTWGAGQEYHDYSREDDSDDDHPRRHRHRRSERRRSPEAPRSATYKIGADHKTTKLDPYSGYGVSPNSTRYHTDAYDHHGSGGSYPTHFKVKEARRFDPNDVKYADSRYNVQYATQDYYSVPA
ncbi:DnaJ-domain-containing protein [Podospora aff. communis PSN243]|uniref:DnaJ-domain-containing protein n=1 Tax=Podospora aff. communis PSN243 TaxID=3040156 RepID=A0AAV9GZ77_9PEZI|nr:DnaJ-domain-containing protein [Podospora aff. communis PSN243]